jgi:hypothetical protein
MQDSEDLTMVLDHFSISFQSETNEMTPAAKKARGSRKSMLPNMFQLTATPLPTK